MDHPNDSNLPLSYFGPEGCSSCRAQTDHQTTPSKKNHTAAPAGTSGTTYSRRCLSSPDILTPSGMFQHGNRGSISSKHIFGIAFDGRTLERKTISAPVASISKRGNTQETTTRAEYPGQAKGSSETECPILFPRRAGAPPKDRRETVNITY